MINCSPDIQQEVTCPECDMIKDTVDEIANTGCPAHSLASSKCRRLLLPCCSLILMHPYGPHARYEPTLTSSHVSLLRALEDTSICEDTHICHVLEHIAGDSYTLQLPIKCLPELELLHKCSHWSGVLSALHSCYVAWRAAGCACIAQW